MPTTRIDGVRYETGAMSRDLKKQLKLLRYWERSLDNLQVLQGLEQTARDSYADALKAELPRAKLR